MINNKKKQLLKDLNLIKKVFKCQDCFYCNQSLMFGLCTVAEKEVDEYDLAMAKPSLCPQIGKFEKHKGVYFEWPESLYR